MSTVVVTGAGGSLGQRVIGLLAAEAGVDRIVALDAVATDPRTSGNGAGIAAKVEYRTLDLAGEADSGGGELDAVLDGATAVIHLAWSNRPAAPAGAAGRSANLASMERLLGALSRTGVDQLVHLSSATVYGAWPDNPVPLAEDTALRPNPGFGFAAEKAEAERMAAEWAECRPGTVLTVLRPAVTVGPPDPALHATLNFAGASRSDDSGRPIQFLHIDDLASAVLQVLRPGRGGVFNVAPDGWIAEETARTLAGGVARLTLPARLVRTLLAWGWALLRTGTPREAAPYALHPWVVANDKLAATGWKPDHTNEEALVTADGRGHWADLPARRRHALVLAGCAGLLVVTGASVAAGLSARRRRRPNRRA